MQRKGGVHDVAFTNGTGPRLHHLAFWVPTPLNIIDLLDLMSTTGYVQIFERGPDVTVSQMHFSYIFFVQTAIAQRSIVQITRPWTQTTNLSIGTLRIRNVKPFGEPPRHVVGLNMALNSKTSQLKTLI
jgi:hypothetical protein